jgi:predicted transcriptional regulator
MKSLIATTLTKYNEAVSRHKELMDLIDTNNVSLSDLHNVLQIVKTLPLIEKYQSDKIPNTKSLEGFIKRQDEVLKQINNTIKR